MINHKVLAIAIADHFDRLENDIDKALAELDCVPLEVRACFQILWNTRKSLPLPSKRAAYAGGMVDGFVLGVRAARIEHEQDVLTNPDVADALSDKDTLNKLEEFEEGL